MPMTEPAVAAAARRLAHLRSPARSGAIDDLPAAERPESLEDAYRVQAALRGLLAEGFGPPAGWKIGCTSPVMQEYLGVPHPCLGTLYADGLRERFARLRAADFLRLGLECEIGVRLGADLPARDGGHDRGSVAPAVAGVMCSVEIVEERFADFSRVGAPSLAADDFFSAGCVLGEAAPPAALPDLALLRGGFSVNGAEMEATGTGEAILGHPLNALAWLADLRAAQGEPLRAGEVATLGSVVRTIYPKAGERVVARFDGLGEVVIEVV